LVKMKERNSPVKKEREKKKILPRPLSRTKKKKLRSKSLLGIMKQVTKKWDTNTHLAGKGFQQK